MHSIFARFADKFERVAVFGSRAMGRARPGSDIDIVVHGPIAEGEIAALRDALEESDLSIFADVVAYDRVAHPPLRAEIDRNSKTLFSPRDLQAKTAAA